MGTIQNAVNGALGTAAHMKAAQEHLANQKAAAETRQQNIDNKLAETTRHNMANEANAKDKQDAAAAEKVRHDMAVETIASDRQQSTAKVNDAKADKYSAQANKITFSMTERLNAVAGMKAAQKRNRAKIPAGQPIEDIPLVRPFEQQRKQQKKKQALNKSIRGRRF